MSYFSSFLIFRTYRGDREDPDDCSICLDTLTVGDEILLLPCNHVFHKNCMNEWLKEGRAVCPVCRQGIMDDDELNWILEGRVEETSRMIQKGGKIPFICMGVNLVEMLDSRSYSYIFGFIFFGYTLLSPFLFLIFM